MFVVRASGTVVSGVGIVGREGETVYLDAVETVKYDVKATVENAKATASETSDDGAEIAAQEDAMAIENVDSAHVTETWQA